MVRVPTHRPPIHPGEMLLEEFLKPMDLSQRYLADAIGVPYQRINEIVNGRRGITPSTAVRLGHFFDMSSGFWLNLQTRWDLYHAERSEAAVLREIPNIAQASARLHATELGVLTLGEAVGCSVQM